MVVGLFLVYISAIYLMLPTSSPINRFNCNGGHLQLNDAALRGGLIADDFIAAI